jgi:hypothetical protein
MNRVVPLLLLTVSLAFAADEIVPGTYAGDLTSSDGKLRKYIIVFTRNDDGRWHGEVDGSEGKAKMNSLEVNGANFHATYHLLLRNQKHDFTIAGRKSNDLLSGTFETASAGKKVDAGTWTTSLIHAQPRIPRP